MTDYREVLRLNSLRLLPYFVRSLTSRAAVTSFTIPSLPMLSTIALSMIPIQL
jgi:hypothetical protein